MARRRVAQDKSGRGWRLARGCAGVLLCICSLFHRAHCLAACARFLFGEGRWPEVLVGGYEGRIWVMVFGEDLGLFDQRIFSPASVGSMAPTSSMARPNPF